jgi:phosphoserine phosphatase
MATLLESRPLSASDLQAILAVTRALAAPFDLSAMLGEVVNAAKQVLHAERVSVWLYDEGPDELVLEVAIGIAPVRIPAGAGLAGSCARQRIVINVPDCYADPRFDPSMDRRSGYRTRCMLTLPLIDHKDRLVGVMQVLNKSGGSFDSQDEALATALAAQCAVALQRVRMTAAVIEGEKMRQELETARRVQEGTLPATMPQVAGYDVHGAFEPADLTGGDTFDLCLLPRGLVIVLADATGHGIAPALSVTQMHAMLRMAFRLDAGLEAALLQVNNQLAETLPGDRFITAFVGVLDPCTHTMRFVSAGQGPIVQFRARDASFLVRKPTGLPLGAMTLAALRPGASLDFDAGDVLLLLSDGIYDYRSVSGEPFGQARVEAIVREHHPKPAAELCSLLLDSVRAFAGGAPQEDDITLVVVKRAEAMQRPFARSFDALPEIVAFTDEAFRAQALPAEARGTVDLAIEELFTNVVKYNRGTAQPVTIAVRGVPYGVEVMIEDPDAEPFDVTRSPEVDTSLPIEARTPGGLGLQLVRRLVDALTYDYDAAGRRSRVTFRKEHRPGSDPAALDRKENPTC